MEPAEDRPWAVERRRARRAPSGWDVRPGGGGGADYAGFASGVDGGGVGGASAGAGALTDAAAQQTRHARRLYVGGLTDVPEREIESFFADVARRAAIRPLVGACARCARCHRGCELAHGCACACMRVCRRLCAGVAFSLCRAAPCCVVSCVSLWADDE